MRTDRKYYLIGEAFGKDSKGKYEQVITEFANSFKSLRAIAKYHRRHFNGQYKFRIYRIRPAVADY